MIETMSIAEFKNLRSEDYEVFDEETGEWVSFNNSCYNKSISGGFPKPEKAEHPVTAISLHDSVFNKYYLWTLSDYDASKTEHKGIAIEHVKFKTEEGLLKQLISFWSDEFTCPDVMTGWNIRTFDVPYLINRITRVLGEDYAQRLSPWGLIEQRSISVMKKQVQVYDLVGIAQLDFLDLFKKFGYTFGPQENYRLDTIANVVLGERKMSYEEYGSLTNLYKENSQLYNDYCLKDTILVVRMEQEIAMITLSLTMAYKAGVNYSDTMGTTAIWDQFIHRHLMNEKTIVPPSRPRNKDEFEGAYVKDPDVGAHDWVCSFDVNSMHPSLIVQCNMSPETLLKGNTAPGMNVDKMLTGYVNTTDYAMSATGQYFLKDKQGVLPKLVELLYNERKAIKKNMLGIKQQIEELKNRKDISLKSQIEELQIKSTQLDNEQTAVKILLNSLFGATGNRHFRYYAVEIAESITVTSQFVIRWAEKKINEFLNKLLKSNNVDYVLYCDTDSTYVKLDALVKNVFGEYDNSPETITKITDFLDKVCQKIEDDVLKPGFDEMAKNMNAFKPQIAMKREGISSRGIFIAKKRYFLNVIDNEGIRYAKPKLKVMGVEAVKSSTPAPCRDMFKTLFDILLSGTEEEAQKFIADFKNRFIALPVEDKAFPRGVSSVKDYKDPRMIYKKGTPINSRAALLYNHMLKKCGIEDKYEAIGDGDKLKYVYLDPKNPTREDVIGFTTILPTEFGLHQYVNSELQFQKSFVDPAQGIMDAIGWSVEETSTLEDFFN